MSDKILNERQINILSQIEYGKNYNLKDLGIFLNENKKPSLATLRRDVNELCSLKFLKQTGELKGTRYSLTSWGMIHLPIDAHSFCNTDTDKRSGNTQYNFSLFSEFTENIFGKEEKKSLDEATEIFRKKSEGASDTIRKKELERFVIELSWKSSKIEGNTYSLIDTEILLKEGIQAEGHTKKEAIMILNHKKAFQYAVAHQKQYKKISVRLIEDIHRLLVEGLGVSFGLRKKQVGITGSKYMPLSVPSQINEALEGLCTAIEKMESPYEKALLALVGISYIQPFEDGNKRTARLVANAILVAYDCAPLSYRNVDEVKYRESILVFYEKNSIIPMLEIFKEQYLFACKNYLKF